MGYDDSLRLSDVAFESFFAYTTEGVALMVSEAVAEGVPKQAMKTVSKEKDETEGVPEEVAKGV